MLTYLNWNITHCSKNGLVMCELRSNHFLLDSGLILVYYGYGVVSVMYR